MHMEDRIARDLLSIGAVFLRPEQPFTWASGIKSPVYCDNPPSCGLFAGSVPAPRFETAGASSF